MFADFCEMLQSSGICGCGFFRSPGSLHEVFLLADRNKKKNEIFSQGFGLRFSPSSVAPPPPPAESEKQPTLTPHRFPPPAPNKLNPRPVSPPRPERKNRRSPLGNPSPPAGAGCEVVLSARAGTGRGPSPGEGVPRRNGMGPAEGRTGGTDASYEPRGSSPPSLAPPPVLGSRESLAGEELEQAGTGAGTKYTGPNLRL